MGRAQPPTTAADSLASLLGDYVDGERGRKLRSQLASMHSRRSPEEVEDAVQTACRCFLGEAEGIEAPGQVYAWIRTAAHRALNREDERGERVQAVDPVEGSLARAPSEEPGPAEEAIAGEEASELAELVREVAGALPERKRRVLALYGAGYKRPQIASRLGLTRRGVKRDLLEIMEAARGVLARRAGGGCEHGERMVMRLACGLASPEEAERAHRHLAGCGRCGQLSERLAAWREKVPAVLPFPAADQASPGLLERAAHKAADGAAALRGHLADGGASLKQQAAAGYYRAVDPTPLAAARPGAVAAVVAGCITLGSGATYCVQRGVVDPLGTARGLIASKADEPDPEPERAPAQRPETEPQPEPDPQPAAAEEVPVSEEVTFAPEAEEPAPEREPEPEPVPPPPPEQTFEPASPGYSEASASSTEAAGTEAAEESSSPPPAPVPAGSSPEFGGP